MTDLERLRQQCRIDFEDPATDSLLLSLQRQGEAFVLSRVNRTREELVEIGGGEWSWCLSPTTMPTPKGGSVRTLRLSIL